MSDVTSAPFSQNHLFWRFFSFVGALAIVFVLFLAEVLGWQGSYENPFLLLALNTLFQGLLPIGTAIFSALGFLRTGSLSLLFMGASMLALGCSSPIAGAVTFLPTGANLTTTIHNYGCLIASLWALLSGLSLVGIFGLHPSRKGRRRLQLFLIFGATAVSIFLIAWLAIGGLTPPFFIPGSGTTSLRQLVLSAAIFSFLLTTVLFADLFFRSKSSILYDISFASFLFSFGLVAIILQRNVGGVVGWMGRGAQYAAMTLFFVSLVRSWLRMRNSKESWEYVVYNLFRNPLEQEILRQRDVLLIKTEDLKQLNQLLRREILEHERAEIKLKDALAEAQRFRDALDHVSSYIYMKDTQFRYIYGNKQTLELFGCTAEQLCGADDSSFFPPEAAKRLREIDARVFRGERTTEEIDVADAERGQRVYLEVKNPIFKELGGNSLMGLLGISTDITERKRMEQEVQKAQRLESLGILAGGIAHDFNNLLNGIFGYIEMAHEGLRLNDCTKVGAYLTKATMVFERARALTQQLLTFSKGGAPARKLGDLGKTVYDTCQFALSGSSVQCEYRIEEHLWLSEYDSNQISQVIDNMIINARQAMSSGGRLEVAISNVVIAKQSGRTLSPGSYVKISIKDSGIGIPKEHLGKIFDPFFTTKQYGCGLGLATSWSIIRRHEGSVEVESESGNGTTFTIFLPACAKNLEPAQVVNDGELCGIGHILIMDDEEYNRELLKEMLTSMGYTVRSAGTGEEALILYDESISAGMPFSAMIFDLTVVGGMGGKETIERLLTTNSKVRVIAASGYVDDPVIVHPENYGFADALCKPYRKRELGEVLKRVLAAQCSDGSVEQI